MSKYWSFLQISFKQTLANRWGIVGRFFFFGIILFVFSKLWSVIEAKQQELPLSARDLVWYLALTEWIVLSTPFVSREIDEEIKSGNVAYLMARPVSYFWAKVASTYGALLTRFIILGFGGCVFAYFFSGGLPTQPLGILVFIPLALIASLIALIFQSTVGVTAFWTQDSFPLYLIYQKLLFVLGGMMLPLQLYPDWLRQIADLSPFPVLLFEPAMAALQLDFSVLPGLLTKMMIWAAVAAALGQWVFMRACRGMNLNGG